MASQSWGWTGAAVGSPDRRRGRLARLPYRLAVIVPPAGSTDSGRRSGGSRWLSAPAPKAAGAAGLRPGYRPAPRSARRLDLEQRKSAMKQFGPGPRCRTGLPPRTRTLNPSAGNSTISERTDRSLYLGDVSRLLIVLTDLATVGCVRRSCLRAARLPRCSLPGRLSTMTQEDRDSGYLTVADILKQLHLVDDPDAIELAASSPALQAALRWSRPPNLWGTGIDPLLLLRLARDVGIPLAWVPRREIVRALVAAPTIRMVSNLLTDQAALIVDDCAEVLSHCIDKRLQGQAPLAEAAVAAYRAGHTEAAMALAVSLGEPLAAWASTPRVRSFDSWAAQEAWLQRRRRVGKYRWAELELEADPDPRFRFTEQLVMAPIPRFFTPWFPRSGDAPPEALSRHVVAHQPTAQHFTAENSLVAIMLMASLLRQQQAWCEDLGPDDPSEAA